MGETLCLCRTTKKIVFVARDTFWALAQLLDAVALRRRVRVSPSHEASHV